MYQDIASPAGSIVKSASQVRAEVEAGLVAAGVNLILARRVTSEGAKPMADGNLLHQLVLDGTATAASVVDLITAPRGGGAATFAAGQLQKKFKHAGDFGVAGVMNSRTWPRSNSPCGHTSRTPMSSRSRAPS